MLGVLCIMFITSREKKTKQQHSSFKEGKPNSQMTPKKKKKTNEERERWVAAFFVVVAVCFEKEKCLRA
jgi:transposase